jgi:hypothetical protein
MSDSQSPQPKRDRVAILADAKSFAGELLVGMDKNARAGCGLGLFPIAVLEQCNTRYGDASTDRDAAAAHHAVVCALMELVSRK